MNPSLDPLIRRIRAKGVVDAEDVKRLDEHLQAAGSGGKDEAELLLEISTVVSGSDNDPGWKTLFVEALTEHALGGPGSSNALDGDKAAYLIYKLGEDAKLDDVRLDLLVNVFSFARTVPDFFLDYVLAAIRRAVEDEGLIGEARAAQIRRIIYRQGRPEEEPVERRLAEFLFDLNDAMTDRPNHQSWSELVVEAISDHVLEDEESPGEVDATEAEWLVRRIKADGRYDHTEKALLAKIKHFVSHNEVWGGIRSDDLQASASGVVTSLYSRACDGGKGGDFYYFSVSASDLLTRIAVADVQGHGPAVSDVSQWIYESLAERINSAEGNEVLADLNRLAADRGYRALTTAVVVTFYRPEDCLYFAYAGHPPMFVRRTSDDRWRPVTLVEGPEAANLPLGVDPDMRYDQQQIPLGKGDRLFLYTDGVVEAPDPNRQLFGASRLLAALEAGTGGDPKQGKDAVLAALEEHTGGYFSHDDVTFMLVEVR